MNLNERLNKEKDENPLDPVMDCMDGFVIVGYLKEGHKKVAHIFSNDPACRDALTYFDGAVGSWLELGQDNENQEE